MVVSQSGGPKIHTSKYYDDYRLPEKGPPILETDMWGLWLVKVCFQKWLLSLGLALRTFLAIIPKF